MRTSTVDHVIIRECAGHIGALQRVIDLVAEYFAKTSPEEDEVLAFCFSTQLVQTAGGLFEVWRGGTLSLSSELRDFLVKCFLNQPDTVPPPMEGEDLRCFTLLIEEGVIVQDTDSVVTFTSPLAGRRYVKYLYPNRLGS
ncbi:hypothetical protein DVH05_015215 [Phytophthora capsici]|nr:hypothetical protein DVH05_015215 [Phytophthora capsici]